MEQQKAPEVRVDRVVFGDQLPELARQAISAELYGDALPMPRGEWGALAATFVTLTLDGKLRGCVGSLRAHRPLGEDVINNARAAAFHDPRFAPVGKEELARLTIEVSVLSPPYALPSGTRDEALAALTPGRDGVILETQQHRATFLPQVWAQLPTPQEFMAQLLRKAGLPPDYWSEDIQLSRYTVSAFSEDQEAES